MQIIVMHPRLAQARSVTLNGRMLIVLGLAFLLMTALLSVSLTWLTVRFGGDLPLPGGQSLAQMAAQEDSQKKEKFLRENLNLMALKLGEMQAQLARLDALGERVQGLSGVKPEEFNFRELPGRGGAYSEQHSHDLSMHELKTALDDLAHGVEQRADYMNVVETALMNAKIKSRLLPTIQPVNVSYNASGFGWRIDPFSGRNAFHEGIDFSSANGTPIKAAAGGVVIAAEFHPQYGNMLDIDHGNEIVTRYAHASRLLAKVGDIIKRGQHIADIGSTGRSTGAHLHFEVHVKGVPQDPHKFLQAGADVGKLAQLNTPGKN
ncbi:M23 family metallopeptidase [Massilia sp. W12]|uniref:M23 family metallopeptidase n=1 Tax=Massilia sp. W12 TaxID=3126507 RepID=UPI0030D0E036